MLPKAQRLTGKEMARIQRHAHGTMRSPFFDVKYSVLPETVTGKWKWGFVITKKQLKGAVARHQLRRRYFRILQNLTKASSFDLHCSIMVKNPTWFPEQEFLRRFMDQLEKNISRHAQGK